ncbi:MAG: orotidine-5'-phosphate decarboxylase [Moraxellaceae bacterium]|nr:orotidine-5'-phosphate decarboxylase [Moraxellaceae bacterium]
MNQTFTQKINSRFKETNNLLCVGLDISLDYLKQHFVNVNPLELNKRIVDATAEYALCFKPQFAYYGAIGQEKQLAEIIEYVHKYYPEIPVILDSKRGDIGTTAEKYAEEAFFRYQADAVTVNPYMGFDAIAPFLEYEDKGTIVLARTSNPTSDFLLTEVDNMPLYLHWAMDIFAEAENQGFDINNLQYVVGATDLQAITIMRNAFPNNWLLVPGVGIQGGKADEVVATAKRENNPCPMTMVNVSRGILPTSNTIIGLDEFSKGCHKLARQFSDDIEKGLTSE